MDIFTALSNCPETTFLSGRSKEIFNSVMELKSPMLFNDDFASDEELDALEREMDIMDSQVPEAMRLKRQILSIKSSISTNSDYV